MTTATATPGIEKTTLATQARRMSEHFPELYDHLKRRDEKLARALRRIPSRADIELAATFNSRSHLERALQALGPGLRELSESEATDGR